MLYTEDFEAVQSGKQDIAAKFIILEIFNPLKIEDLKSFKGFIWGFILILRFVI